jgi:NADH-quinone oxidoreductase subunit C
MAEFSENLRKFLRARFSDDIIREDDFRGQQTFYVTAEALPVICEALLEDSTLEIRMLADITSVDWYDHPEAEHGRFELIYNLLSLSNSARFFLKVRLPEENPQIKSLTHLWNGANWMEREVWDMMGIKFEGHPDLKKILTPDELEGHPLRRDFPLTYEVPQFSWNKDDPPEVIK